MKQIEISVKSLKGSSFVGVRNYTNANGETTNQTFLVGINYENLLKNDLQTLQNFDISVLTEKHDADVLKIALAELIDSYEKRLLTDAEKSELIGQNSTINRSVGQQEAYIHIAKGLKTRNEGGNNYLYLYGLMVRKTVLVKGEYKKANSRPLTLAKNAIKYAAELRETKYKIFKLGRLEEIRIKGITI